MQTNTYQHARAKLQPDRFGVPKTQEDLYAQLKLLQYATQRHGRELRLVDVETKLSALSDRHATDAHDNRTARAIYLAKQAQNDRQLSRASQIYYCTTRALIAKGEEGHCFIRMACKDRLCPDCQKRRYSLLREKATKRATNYHQVKLVTLTLAYSTDPIGAQVDRLLAGFRRLRATAYWKAQVKGGMWVIEFTERKDGTHHVHLHAVVDTPFIKRQWLSDKWREITGDSYITHVKRKSGEQAGYYVAKYATKGPQCGLSRHNPWAIADQLAGRKLVGTFGDVAGFASDDPEPRYEIKGTLEAYLEKARAGDDEALSIIEECLQNGTRVLGEDTA